MSTSSSSSSSSSSTSSPITHLGYDHILTILHLLPIDSILSFSCTCKNFSIWASTDPLWEQLCRRDWGHYAVDSFLAGNITGARRSYSWKRFYLMVSKMSSLSCTRISCKGVNGGCPRPRASHSVNMVVGGWLVLFGGGCDGGRHLDDTWVAYVGNGADTGLKSVLSWQQVNSGIPSGRFGHTCTLVGDSLVLFGGIIDTGVRLNDTWIGQVICEGPFGMKISWRLLEVGSIAPPPRGAHAACCVEDHILVIHGGIGLYGLRLGDTWLLELSDGFQSGKWHQRGNNRPLPPPRSGQTLTWVGETRMILFGGRGSGYEVLNDVWLFDIGTGHPEWKELKYDLSSVLGEMPIPRVGHSATLVIGGKILVYGGEDTQRHRMDDSWLLDVPALLRLQSGSKKPTRRIWKKLHVDGQCPNYRSFHGTCSDISGRNVYIFGGMVDGPVPPGEGHGFRFDGELYHVKLVLHL